MTGNVLSCSSFVLTANAIQVVQFVPVAGEPRVMFSLTVTVRVPNRSWMRVTSLLRPSCIRIEQEQTPRVDDRCFLSRTSWC